MGDKDRFVQIFSKNIRSILNQLRGEMRYVQEVRLRVNSPLFVFYKNQEFFIDGQGNLKAPRETGFLQAYMVTREDVEETLACAAGHSLYAFEDELRQGFITVSGGHRIGVAGRIVLCGEGIKTIQPAASLNVRFSHQVKGCGNGVVDYLYEKETERFFHTLLISPPCCGKTTLLRDLVRQISNGRDGSEGESGKGQTGQNIPHRGRNVGVVDERSEIGACFQGIPQNDVGMRTDILDGCPKAEGMMMLIRSMAPSVVAVDEIGGKGDLEAVRYVMNCGCGILATVHGTTMDDVRQKPILSQLLEEKIFERYVVLSGRKGPGTVENICDREGRSLICG